MMMTGTMIGLIIGVGLFGSQIVSAWHTGTVQPSSRQMWVRNLGLGLLVVSVTLLYAQLFSLRLLLWTGFGLGLILVGLGIIFFKANGFHRKNWVGWGLAGVVLITIGIIGQRTENKPTLNETAATAVVKKVRHRTRVKAKSATQAQAEAASTSTSTVTSSSAVSSTPASSQATSAHQQAGTSSSAAAQTSSSQTPTIVDSPATSDTPGSHHTETQTVVDNDTPTASGGSINNYTTQGATDGGDYTVHYNGNDGQNLGSGSEGSNFQQGQGISVPNISGYHPQ